MRIEFIGRDLFIGELIHVYPARMGYWIDRHSADSISTDTQVVVMDDFGNLVDVLDRAHARAHYRQSLH